MGFGPIFLGFMLLFDFQTALSHTSGGEVYAVVDIFPNVLAFLLIFWGLTKLAGRNKSFQNLRRFSLLMLALSLFILLKDTLFFKSFYTDGVEGMAGQWIGFFQHLLILLFSFFLFRRTAAFLSDNREEKLSRSHQRTEVFLVMEGIIYIFCFILAFFRLEGVMANGYKTLKMLDMMLWVFCVWYGGIALFRAMTKTQEL